MNKCAARHGLQAGSILILACGVILVLTALALVLFDAGRIFLVRMELQAAADSAALAGAGCLTRESLAGSGIECSLDRVAQLNWARAETRALDQLGQNSADNTALSTTDGGHVIEAGYWNLLLSGATGGTMSTQTGALEAYDTPGLKVTVIKDEGMNGGLLSMMSAALFGGANVALRASSVAVLAAPGKASANSLAPYVINRCLLDSYWDSTTGQPALATAGIMNGVEQTPGQPWEFRLGPGYIYADSELDCSSGQWTSFAQNAVDTESLRNLIVNGNPDAITIGDEAWIEAAADALLYGDLAQQYLQTDIPLLVVESSDTNQPGWAPIVAIAGFHVTAVSIGDRYIQGHFIRNLILPGATGAGPSYFGVYTPPRLAQ
jgi:hypothetical protein